METLILISRPEQAADFIWSEVAFAPIVLSQQRHQGCGILFNQPGTGRLGHDGLEQCQDAIAGGRGEALEQHLLHVLDAGNGDFFRDQLAEDWP